MQTRDMGASKRILQVQKQLLEPFINPNEYNHKKAPRANKFN